MTIFSKCLGTLVLLSALGACGGGGGGGDGGSEERTGWQFSQLLENLAGKADQVDVSINAAGTGYAVWRQANGGELDVFSSRYSNGVWEPALPVTGANVNAEFPQVAVLSDGEALAVWKQTVPQFGVGVFSSRTVKGVWQDALFVQLLPENVEDLDVTADTKDGAMVVWSRTLVVPNGPVTSNVFARAFFNGAFEAAAQQLNAAPSKAFNPKIAIDMSGSVLAVWAQDDGPNNILRIKARSYENDLWGQEGVVSNPNEPLNATLPVVAASANGVSSVVWKISNGRLDMNSSTAFGSGTWKGVETVAAPGNNFSHNVAVDELGHTTVAFFRAELGSTKLTTVRKLDSGFKVATLPVVGATESMQAKSDAGGATTVVWNENTVPFTRFSVKASRLDPNGVQLSNPETIETEDRGSALSVSLAVSAGGRAIAAWQQQDGTLDQNGNPLASIVANIFK